MRFRVVYEGPVEGARRLMNQLRSAGLAVENGPPPEHPDILIDEVRAVFFVTPSDAPGAQSSRTVGALVGRLVSPYPNVRFEIDEVPD